MRQKISRVEARPIRTEADYDLALKQIQEYFENEPRRGSVKAARFNALARAIEAYESVHWRIER